jgi:membrane protein YqaA with SNARE-associated domain
VHWAIVFLSISAWLRRLGGPGLVLLGLADNSLFPTPGSMDALTIVLSAHQKGWWPYYAVMATIGGLLGGYVTYMLGAKGGQEALEKKLHKKKAERIYKIFHRFGFWSLFIPAMLPPPVPFSPFLLTAGALKYPRKNFFLAVGMGRAIRYSVLAYLGSMYSRQIFHFFRTYRQPILWTSIALAVAGSLAALIWFWRRTDQSKPVISGAKRPHTKVA